MIRALCRGEEGEGVEGTLEGAREGEVLHKADKDHTRLANYLLRQV